MGLLCALLLQHLIVFQAVVSSREALKFSTWKKKVVSPLAFYLFSHASFIHYPSKEEYMASYTPYTSLANVLIFPTPVAIPVSKSSVINKPLVYTVSRFDPIKNIPPVAKILSRLSETLDLDIATLVVRIIQIPIHKYSKVLFG